jgi:hypothetical protein
MVDLREHKKQRMRTATDAAKERAA